MQYYDDGDDIGYLVTGDGGSCFSYELVNDSKSYTIKKQTYGLLLSSVYEVIKFSLFRKKSQNYYIAIYLQIFQKNFFEKLFENFLKKLFKISIQNLKVNCYMLKCYNLYFFFIIFLIILGLLF